MNKELQKRQKEQCRRMQDSLTILRTLAGWTMQDMADRLGCTKQNISRLENKKNEMSFVQCIAIRTILGMEIEELDKKAAKNKDSEAQAKSEQLKTAITILLDMPEDQITQEMRDSIEAAAKAAKGGVSRILLKKILPMAATAVGVAAGVAVVGTSWLLKLNVSSDEENEKNDQPENDRETKEFPKEDEIF